MDFRANLINGQWRESSSGKRLKNISPVDAETVLHEVPDSEPADAVAAVDAAAAALPGWAALPPQKRGAILLKASEVLAKRHEEASRLLSLEMGKPIKESRGEVQRSVDLFRYYAGFGWRLAGKYVASDAPGEVIYTIPIPLGVVTLITPWNFPSAIPVWKMAPALVTGNTVVLKPANPAPASSHVIAECLQEAGLPAGVLNVVFGSGAKLSDPLTLDPRVKGISFTGSCGVGGMLYRKAATPGRRIGLEMGGKNPLIVMADADLDQAAQIAIAGAMYSSGQKCTATSRTIVQESVLEPFTQKLVQRVAAMKVGHPLEETTEIGPVVDPNQLKNVLDYVAIGVKEDKATLAVGGKRVTDGAMAKGYYVTPAVFTHVTGKMRIAQEEIFGPVLAVMKAKDLDEALTLSNDVAFGLSAGICTKDMATADAFIRRTDAGLLHINNPTAGAQVHVPFGGLKASSSNDREMGEGGITFFSSVKTVYHKV